MTLASAFVLCRFIHFTAVMLLFGVSLFVVLLSPARLSVQLKRQTDSLLGIVIAACFLSAIGILAVQSGQMGEGWQDSYRPEVWWAVLSTAFGQIWQWHLLLALCAVLVGFLLPAARRDAPLLLIAMALLVSLALIGHAAMHSGMLGWLHRGSQAIHLLSAAYWFGSLLPLLVCLSYTRIADLRSEAIITMVRFSRWGHLAVALVITSGVLNGAIILAGSSLDFGSAYLQLLLFKVGLVALMVAVALFNRYRVVPRIGTEPLQAQRLLIAATWLEIGLGALVLLSVSWFATLQPHLAALHFSATIETIG